MIIELLLLNKIEGREKKILIKKNAIIMNNQEDYEKYKEKLEEHKEKYVLMEKKFMSSRKYVSFEDDNLKTYSEFYEGLILKLGSEIDKTVKDLCDFLKVIEKSNDILVREKIRRQSENMKKSSKTYDCFKKMSEYSGFFKQPLHVKYFSKFTLVYPLNEIQSVGTSNYVSWWKKYNAVKHKREIPCRKGNLENALILLQVLYLILNIFNDIFIKVNGEFPKRLINKSKIFDMDDKKIHLLYKEVK